MKYSTRFVVFAATFFLTAGALCAGVVYEIEVKDHESDPPKTESIEMAAEGRFLKMGIASGGNARDGEMIFKAERREVTVVDGENRSYYVMDEAFMKNFETQMAGQAGGMEGQLAIARKELQKHLGNMTEEQKRGLEQALGNPKGGAGGIFGAEPAEIEVRKTGQKATHVGYPCVRYEVLRGGEKIQEFWVTDWKNVKGGTTVKKSFTDLSAFFAEMAEAGMGATGEDGFDFFTHMKDLDGFPVVTKSFEGGELEQETWLRGVEERDLDPDAFEPPAGYKRQEMFGGR